MSKIIEFFNQNEQRYIDKFSVSPLIANVLAANDVSDEHVRELLSHEAYVRSENELFLNAKRIIESAISTKEKILICGDYDADGLCATSIMVRSLRKAGADVGFYIPDRFIEGYGLSKATIVKAYEKGYTLFITVDNGVAAFEALEAIQARSAQVLVLDHHEITQDVPCDLLIHPSLLGDEYSSLCGSGLALQLAEHLIGTDEYNTALAGIATIGDMVELWGANRKIVIDALRILNHERYPAIEALNEKPIDRYDEETLAFQIVPKLNVVGRLADEANANRIVDYLCSDSLVEIKHQAQQIIELNKKRKLLSNAMYETAATLRKSGNVVVLTHPSFHEGIVGITAGRLAKEIGRPVFIFAQKGTTLKGSARSVATVDLRTLTQSIQGLCIRYGGHAMAAGLEIKGEDFEKFSLELNQQADMIDWSDAQETLLVCSPDKNTLTQEDFLGLLALAPFGSGFPMPLMRFKDCQVLSYRMFPPTLRRWRLKWGNVEFDAVYFGILEDETLSLAQGNLDLIGKVKTVSYRNIEKLSILIEVIGTSL